MNPRILPSQSVDVWACGAILNFLQTHEPPLRHIGSPHDLEAAMATEQPRPKVVLQAFTEKTQAAILACLHMDPRRRAPDLVQLQAELETTELDNKDGSSTEVTASDVIRTEVPGQSTAVNVQRPFVACAALTEESSDPTDLTSFEVGRFEQFAAAQRQAIQGNVRDHDPDSFSP